MYREKPPIRDYVLRYHKPAPSAFLAHYGVKGMKWGVRRTPAELGYLSNPGLEKTKNSGIMKTTVSGHKPTPKRAEPHSVIDHISDDGTVDSRSFYDEHGWKDHDIHTSDHGFPKHHPFGVHGEHVDEYEWNEDGTMKKVRRRELTPTERKENHDIL